MKNSLDSLKIVILGAGSSYTPELIEGLISHRDSLPLRELCLVDVEEGKDKLAIITALTERMLSHAKYPLTLRSVIDRKSVLADADYVVCQIRVGRMEARIKDEAIPLSFGILGQETTGAGGMMCGLRTIPALLEICRDMEALCPNAWLINFANPSGMITEAILRYSNIRAIGLCNAPLGVRKSIAGFLHTDERQILPEFVGLNHLHWVTSVMYGETECLPALLSSEYQAYTAPNVSGPGWDSSFLKALGAIPSYYLRYYYMHADMLESMLLEYHSGNMRALKVMDIEKKLFSVYADPHLAQKPDELSHRGGAYYSEAAICLIDAIHNNRHEIHTVNVQNNGTLPFLPACASIEVNCEISSSGAKPICPSHIPRGITGLITCVKEYESLIVEAAVEGDFNKIVLAMTAHPLIPDIGSARKMLDSFFRENQKYLPLFRPF